MRGIMDTSHKPTVNIIVGPASEENFASSVQKPNTFSFYLFFWCLCTAVIAYI